MYIAIALTTAYLLGAIPFAFLIARLTGVKDLRRIGSGNLGATNVWRAAGPVAGVSVFLADIGKGAVAIWLARFFLADSSQAIVSSDIVLVVAGLMAVLGHVFPIYLGFRGGKGAATGLGMMAMLLPIPTLVAFVVFAVIAATWRYISLATILGAISLFVVVTIQKFWLAPEIDLVYFIMTMVLTLFIVFTHRQNISRLISGTENRINLSRSSEAGSHG